MNPEDSGIPKELLERPPVPKEAAGTDVYRAESALLTLAPLNTVPDLLTATNRNKRWGVLFSCRVIPDLDQVPEGPMMFPHDGMQFIDADNLDALKARMLYEVDVAIDIAKKVKDLILQQNSQKIDEAVKTVVERHDNAAKNSEEPVGEPSSSG